MIDIGQRIKDELERQERSVYWLAQKLGINRSVVHRNLEKTTIDTGLLRRICVILQHDFFRDCSEDVAQP